MSSSNEFTSPIVVIGAGAAGIYFSLKIGKFKEILLLESGPSKTFIENDKFNNFKTTKNRPYRCGHIGRVRGYGGATNIWGGQMLPFDEKTFSSEKGWPIKFSDLKPFYESVSNTLLHKSLNFGINNPISEKIYKNLFVNTPFYVHITKWISNPVFSKTIGRYLPSKVKLLENVTVIGIEPKLDGKYKLHCENRNLKKFSILASNVVVSTGTIETVRLLQLSRKRFGLPVNSSLGKGFIDHLSYLEGICELKPKNRWLMLKHFYTKISKRGKRSSIRISTKVNGLKIQEDLASSYYIGVSAPSSKWMKIINNFCSVISVLLFGFVFKPFGKIILTGIFEQNPNKKNRYIKLQSDNLPFINSPPSNEEIDIFLYRGKLLVDTLFKGGWLKEKSKISSSKILLNKVTDVCHPMGGTQLNIDKNKTVVTRNLELINCPNIWINSASIFPSGSHSNPTMTLLAFSDRLANYILSLK